MPCETIFACLESEARLALLAHGCDPQMGCLHADQRNRDSLALDAIEPVREDVDAFLFDLLEDREFTAIGASQRGGLVACPGGPYMMKDGREAIRALSWEQVAEIVALFAQLNPYDRTAVPHLIGDEPLQQRKQQMAIGYHARERGKFRPRLRIAQLFRGLGLAFARRANTVSRRWRHSLPAARSTD
jgi:hypothetical protein